ncbi:MAG: hypothetical protein WC379_09860 [Methanoregula sp.]
MRFSRAGKYNRVIIVNRDQQPEIFPGRTGIMDYRIIIIPALVLVVLLAVAGCTSPEQPVTPMPTPVPTPEPTTPAIPVPTTQASTEPGPVDTLPSEWDLSITVEKGGMYSRTILAKFDGGKGLNYASRMDVRVTYPDGTVKMDGIAKPKMGDSVEILGSDGTDRVEVFMLMASGTSYKIIDQQMPYRNKY